MSVTSAGARGGHHHASDFIYASPYELIDKNNDSEIYIPASVSLRMNSPIRMTPPPLPQRNNNYSPPPRMAPISNSRSSPPTPEVTQAFPNTPSPIIATNNELKVVIEVHNEQDPLVRPSSLQQLQEMLDPTKNLENINQNTLDMSSIPQEKDGFLSRKVGYEIERRLVKAVQVRTLRKKRQKKGHYHYYPFYEKNSKHDGFWGWLRQATKNSKSRSDHVYTNPRRRKKRKRHHRFCIKCVTSSFASLFRVLREPIAISSETIKKTEVKNPQLPKESQPRAISRTATEATRTPTPKMLLDMKSGAIHWPVYQFGGQSGSGMLLSAQALRKNDKKPPINNENEPGRENFSLGPGKATQLQIENKSSKSSSKNELTKSFSNAAEEDERKLIGWLQVRNPNNRKKTFLQVVNPKPEGPFRKAPWHGNVHVMKF